MYTESGACEIAVAMAPRVLTNIIIPPISGRDQVYLSVTIKWLVDLPTGRKKKRMLSRKKRIMERILFYDQAYPISRSIDDRFGSFDQSGASVSRRLRA